MGKTLEVKWNKPIEQVLEDNGLNDKTLLFMANTLKRLYNPYVPFLRGPMSNEVDTYVEGSVGVIHYKSPYAHYQYMGEIYVDPVTGAAGFLTENGWFSRKGVSKIPSGRQMEHTTTNHPLATSLWDEVAKPQIIDQYTREVQAFIGSGRGG